MNFQLPDLGPVIPELIMTSVALVILMADLFIKRKETLAFLSIIGITIVAYSLLTTPEGSTFSGMFVSDGYSTFFKLLFLLNVILSVLISVKYVSIENINLGEYYAFLLFSTLGMMIMASAHDLILVYLGLELMALSTYILTAFLRHDTRSNEASLKYFLLGAFSSAFLLYGIAMSYGITGTTELKAIAAYITKAGLTGNKTLLLSVIFLVVAFGFKIAAVPFHMWAPDVYEGAPTSITAFMSVGPKAAGFAVLGRVFYEAFGEFHIEWSNILLPLSILTMVIGNIIAISQTNIKRMLAYSSIAHAGYALLGVIAGTPEGLASTMNYLMIYAFMNIGAFSIVIMLRSEGFSGVDIEDYKGLSKSHPLASALMLIFMFSLTGIPPTAGFIGKFYVFMESIKAGNVIPVVIAVIMSAVSAYFYLRIVMYMYMHDPEGEITLTTSPSMNLALVITTAGTLFLGILPSFLIEFAKRSIISIF
ncbi:MAG: NADH-quinone oxidoreductase subunit N [Nitrospirota bacterium]